VFENAQPVNKQVLFKLM